MSWELIRNLDELLLKPSSADLRSMRRDAAAIFLAALRAVDPERLISAHVRREGSILWMSERRVDLSSFDSVRLVAFGKASVPMSRGLLGCIEVEEGLVVTDQSEGIEVEGIEVLLAGHPHPDEGSLRAGEAALRMASRSGPRDLLLVLVSGGGSSMLEATDLTLEDFTRTTELMLRSGMDIERLNTVRKHLSKVKGGHLARAATARGGRVVTLAISDVVGDDPSLIASGPTVPDRNTYEDAERVLRDFGLWDSVPGAVRSLIRSGIEGRTPETPKPGDPAFDRTEYITLASNETACRAAEAEARRRGYRTIILTTRLQGEAREVAKVLASIALSVHEEGFPLKRPAAIISGGETTVVVRGPGKGGRNQELALAAVSLLKDREIVLLSCGTDGVDGPTEAAGAVADGETLDRALELGMAPESYLAENDSHGFFSCLGDAVVTGPTGTNVMDLQIILVGNPSTSSEASHAGKQPTDSRALPGASRLLSNNQAG
jgi:glycerate-2-kinase